MPRLCYPRLLIRRIGTAPWYISVGDICATLAKGWPVIESGNIYKVVATNEALPVDIIPLEVEAWEARPIKPVSPLHQAVRRTLSSHGLSDTQEVAVKDFSHYGKLAIACSPQDVARPLLQTAMREGFWDLPQSYLKLIGD